MNQLKLYEFNINTYEHDFLGIADSWVATDMDITAYLGSEAYELNHDLIGKKIKFNGVWV